MYVKFCILDLIEHLFFSFFFHFVSFSCLTTEDERRLLAILVKSLVHRIQLPDAESQLSLYVMMRASFSQLQPVLGALVMAVLQLLADHYQIAVVQANKWATEIGVYFIYYLSENKWAIEIGVYFIILFIIWVRTSEQLKLGFILLFEFILLFYLLFEWEQVSNWNWRLFHYFIYYLSENKWAIEIGVYFIIRVYFIILFIIWFIIWVRRSEQLKLGFILLFEFI